MMYHLKPDKSLRIVPPAMDREELFYKAHGGPFGGHLGDAKVHSHLSRHYWWLVNEKGYCTLDQGVPDMCKQSIG